LVDQLQGRGRRRDLVEVNPETEVGVLVVVVGAAMVAAAH